MSDTTKDAVLTNEQKNAVDHAQKILRGVKLYDLAALLSASKPAAPQNDPDAVTRLKLLCRKLGLEKAIPNELYSNPEGLFVIFGQMRARIDALLSASAAAPAQSTIYQTNFIKDQWRDVDQAEYERAKGLRADLARIVYAAPQPSQTAVVLDDERAADIDPAAYLVRGLDGYNEEYASVWIKRTNADAAAAAIFRASITPLVEARAALPQPVAQPVEQTTGSWETSSIANELWQLADQCGYEQFRDALTIHIRKAYQDGWVDHQNGTASVTYGDQK